jgi:type II secretory pathway pseudopilin PulG
VAVPVVWIIVLAILAVLLLLAIVGGSAASRRNRAQHEGLAERLGAIDRELAAAVAQDRGWERATLEAAAREAFAAHRPDTEIAALELVQVVDKPGTDGDLAVFRVRAGRGATRLTLGRRDDAWYPAAVEDEH